MIFMLSQGWTNETVEYEMDLVDTAVKSLRSLANERRERYMESILKKKFLFICFFGSAFVCSLTPFFFYFYKKKRKVAGTLFFCLTM